MKRHRDEITKCVSFEFDQASLGYLMLDMETMKPSMLGQAPITQESPNQNLLLPTCQYFWMRTNFPRRYPCHASILRTRCDSRTFTDTAGLVIDITVEEDKITPVTSPISGYF